MVRVGCKPKPFFYWSKMTRKERQAMRMYNFEAGVITGQVAGGSNWEVFCNRCQESIGTMAATQVRDAIFSTLGRGGVLCPVCRASTCDMCGQPKEVERVTKGPGGREKMSICEGCMKYLGELEMIGENDDGTTCLVVQNSTGGLR